MATPFKLILLLLLAYAPIISHAQQPERPSILGIALVELQVSDIKKAKTFYEGLLGYRCTPVKKEGRGEAFSIQVNHRQTIRIYGGLPEGQDERLLTTGFQTTDAEAMRAYLKAKGIVVPAKLTSEAGTLSFTIQDPDGHPTQFIQRNNEKPAATVQNHGGSPISDRILHVGLTIGDPATANSFYETILGFSEIWRGGANDSVTHWINMRLPESTDYIEYMLLLNRKPNRQQLGSLHHIALLTPDMQKSLDSLQDRASRLGFKIAAPRIGRNNRWQLNLYDPDGTRIELMEPFTVK
ncbi:VOC family protein [Paraflavitalea sp. CAU 1676]|uniref:VOC family protein n=1 Tax=Paraflavitalea sp. CAU 1676 TaxID=3032598 RepID=UPI0023D98697|nr:VOC family protein [Paraflavitalea sp. CAU 1676]MDF2193469.1 VOC family protein [Paraflavitalea sp. CAU 1676]